MAKAETDELLNTAQTARLFEVGISTVSKWKARHKDFPAEVTHIVVNKTGREKKLVKIEDANLRWRSELEAWGKANGKV